MQLYSHYNQQFESELVSICRKPYISSLLTVWNNVSMKKRDQALN